MTLYDSSVLIDYLDGDEGVVGYVERQMDEPALTPPVALFEVYQGEVFKAGVPDFAAVDRALSWVTVVEGTAAVARAAAELQEELRRWGSPLAARDAYIAGTALELDESLAVRDADFAVDGLSEIIDVDVP